MPPEIVKNGQFDREAAADALRKFLEDTVRAGKLQITVSVRVLGAAEGTASREEEIVADLDGRDKEFLLERGAEALKALEHLACRALRLEPAAFVPLPRRNFGSRAHAEALLQPKSEPFRNLHAQAAASWITNLRARKPSQRTCPNRTSGDGNFIFAHPSFG